ncbi:bacitracin ABC transporter ATP-binding protein, partial [filamentous cyanobacterium Phorm 6]
MVQMARWGDTVFPRNWVEVLERVVRIGPFSTATRELGMSDITHTRGSLRLFDGTVFSGDDPISYLNNLEIKRDFTMAQVILDSGRRAA